MKQQFLLNRITFYLALKLKTQTTMPQIMKKRIYQFAFSNYIQGSLYTMPGESYPFAFTVISMALTRLVWNPVEVCNVKS